MISKFAKYVLVFMSLNIFISLAFARGGGRGDVHAEAGRSIEKVVRQEHQRQGSCNPLDPRC